MRGRREIGEALLRLLCRAADAAAAPVCPALSRVGECVDAVRFVPIRMLGVFVG